MKRTLISTVLLLLIVSLNLKSQDTNKVYPKIQKVVVYQEDAQIEKSITVSLKKGFNEFVLAGNSNVLNTKSIQFNNNSNYSIMEFTPYIQFVKADQVAEEKLSESTRKRVKIIKDSIEILEYKLVEVKNYLYSLEKEKKTLENMKVVSYSSAIDSMPKMKEGLAFFRDKMTDVNGLIQKKQKEMENLNKTIIDYSSNLKIILQGDENDNNQDKSEYYIKVNIYSEKDFARTKIDYRYIVKDIYWSPIYDVNFISNNENVRFTLKSELQQVTGEDWDDVKLVFSTEQPNSQGQFAELEPTYYTLRPIEVNKIPVVTPIRSEDVETMTANSVDAIISTVSGISVDDGGGTARGESGMVTYVNGVSNSSTQEVKKYKYATEDNNSGLGNKMLGKEYEVAMNYTIKSGDKPKIIPLETSTTKASYKYFSVPKMEKVVYLSALLSDWEDMQLMSAGAKVYLDNNFIKDIYINSNSIEDTLNLPIGREKRVVIDRKSDKKLVTKTGFMSSNFETTVTVTINVKNNSQSKVEIKIDDQIPVSKTDEIKINPNDLSKANYEEKTGKLTWNLNLNALESKTINFSYTVKHPKGANLSFN
ncbi:MAG: hypothetical protein H6Q15_66 [Bacteroidetes bacterium]|nr:hypothetical protein [Bacteroidota bacterium]